MKPWSTSRACSSAVQNSQWIDEQWVASATSRTPATSAAVTAATSAPGAIRSRVPVAGVIGAATTSFG
jgi:hypothetical protein